MAGEQQIVRAYLRRVAWDALVLAFASGVAGCAWSSAPAPGFSSSHHKYEQEQSSVAPQSVPPQAEP